MHSAPGAAVVRFAAMEFRILGPLQVFDDARPLALGGRRQRAVLAHLILRANHTVGAEQLVDGLWGDEPPETARNTLQTYVYRLRKVLGEERLEGRDGGYVLTAGPEEVDAARFEAIVKDAKRLSASDPAAAATRFGDALALWRGAPLGDLGEEPSLRGEIARLDELHLSATEHRISAEIASGRNSTVVSELEALTARYPLRERMWANLMLALHRGGRQAEALSAYQRAREVLSEELGTEPSKELQHLNEQILRRDPSLGGQAPPKRIVRPSRVDLQPGTEFAGYRIVSTLGRGGMAVVYLAEHDFLQRKVALKVLAPQLTEDERFRERFVRESRLAASLDHPNVVPIYEAGASGGDLFIAMRYVEGTDLRTLLADSGALDPARAVSITRQVAAALDAAHEQGLVHRDVKPGNVLVARTRGSEAGEHVYLSDFGLTKRSTSGSGVTGTGQFVGTLDYAAPEQFLGETPGARTDVYSLGCVLFECLAGRPPFEAENDAGLMYAHLQEPPPVVTAERADLPREVDGVVAKAMAKAPADRYAAAGALASDASRALGVDADAAAHAGSRGGNRSRRLAAVVAVALALVAGVVLSSFLREDAPQPRVEGSQAPLVTPGPTRPPAFRTVERARSPDEQRLLTYIPEGVTGDCSPLDRDEPIQGELGTLVCRADDVEVLYELFPTQDLMDAAFQLNANSTVAPEGDCATKELAVTSYTVGGELAGRVLCYTSSYEGGYRSHIEWTDENANIYAHAVRNDLGDLSLYEWWLSSAGPTIPSGSTASTLEKDRSAAAGPRLRDGSYLVSLPHDVGRSDAGTYAIHIEDGAYEKSSDGTVDEHGSVLLRKENIVIFDPDACSTAFLGNTQGVLWPAEFAWSARGDSITWEFQEGGPCAGPQGGLERFPWTRAPAGVIALDVGGEVVLVDAGGFGAEDLTADAKTGPNVSPDWSPDGSRIVFAGGAAEGYDLYVIDADGTGLTQLTEANGDEVDPAWSPDGTRIAFAFDDQGAEVHRTGIAVVNPDGTGWTELVKRENETASDSPSSVSGPRRLGPYRPAWSPDGGRIAFTVSASDGQELYVMDAGGGDPTLVHREPGSVAPAPISWTPNGRLVFWGRQGTDQTLLSMRADGSDVRAFAGELPRAVDFSPGRQGLPALLLAWSADDRWIVLSEASGPQSSGIPGAYLMRADGSELFLIANGVEPTWRPDLG
jgi:DNA-binding SARP family transcriptional activator/Tol biopolymer transport system component/tRNA A-37 threonylcarbamoyl transferase component Bud32